MPINLVNAVVRIKVEWIGLRLTLIGRDIRSFSRGLVVNVSPGDIQRRYKKLNFAGLGSTCCTQIEHARDHKT